MFASIFSSLKAENNNDEFSARRRFVRRSTDQCISIIDGITYPVENWSMGGLMIQADERTFAIDDEMPVTIKFKLSQKIVDVPHTARVVRKARNKIAFEFKPLTRNIQDNFKNVLDDYVASQFAASQTGF